MKKKVLVLILSILAVMLCITACGGREEELSVKAIEVIQGTYPTSCEVGDTLDFSGIQVKVTFADDTTKEIGAADLTISAVDTSTVGKKIVTVTYGEKSAAFEITVKEKAAPAATVTAIKIVPGSVPTSVMLQKPYDKANLQVEATYSDGTKKMIPLADVTVSDVDTATAGEKTFTVTYGTFTDTLTVTVLNITEMNVVAGTLTDKIFVGETLDITNLKLSVEYSDESRVEVPVSDLTVGSIDSTTYGKKMLTITYCGVTIEYEVEVVAPVSITVTGGSVAKSVKVKGTLDVSGIKAELLYSDGEKEELTANQLTVTNISTATAGVQKLKVSYTEKGITLETTEDITVVGVKNIIVIDGSVNKEILKGQTYDASGIQVTVTYTDDSHEDKTYAELTLGAIDGNTAGDQTLKITYLDKTVDFPVKVCEITSIRVDGFNRVVPAGENVDLTNMKVFGIYNDTARTEEELTDGEVTDNWDSLDINSEEDKDLVIGYEGSHGTFTTTVKITVTEPEFIGIRIDTYDKVIGIGGAYNKDSVSIYAQYGNDTEEKVTGTKLENVVVSDVTTSAVGNVTLTVTYTEDGVEKSATATVKVLPVTNLAVSGIDKLVDKGGVLDTNSVSVTVTFSDGTDTLTRVVTKANGVVVSTPDTTTGGDKKLTVTYLGFSTDYAYHVKAVSGIEIFNGCPSFLLQGQAINHTNLKIKISYTNGDSAIVLASTLGNAVTYEGTGVNATKFTVTYEGFSASKDLANITIASVSGLNNTVPATVLQYATVLYENMKLTVIGNDGKAYLVGIDDPNLTISTINTSEAKEQAITFKYFGFETSVRVLVKGVKSVEVIEGVLNRINVGQKLDTSELLICVTYTDGTYFYAKAGDPYLTVGSIDTSTAGTKQLPITYQGVTINFPVEVVNITVENGMIFGAMLPDQLVARESYMKNFKESGKAYLVGDDNPFYFYLDIIMLDENDNIVDVNGKLIPTATKVYENGVELTGDALNAVVTFDSSKNSYQFKSAAIGRTFTLEIRPADASSYVDAASVTKTHTVKIVDGYNVYEAWELNMMTNVGDLVDDVTAESAQYKLVDKYLREKHNATRPAKLASLVIHNNLNITLDDIPSEYVITCPKTGGKEFYDAFGVYYRKLSYAEGTQFAIHGNYYSIYSYNLPCIAHKGEANEDNGYANLALFRVRGYDDDYQTMRDHYIADNSYVPFSDMYFFVEDMALRDNDPNSNDQSASERHIRGSQAFLVGRSQTDMTNVNIDAYMISVNVEGDNSILNLNKVKFYNAWQGHLFLWSDNYYQQGIANHAYQDVATWDEVRPLTVNITDSFLAKCGGPVILAQNANRQYASNNNVGVDVTVDDKSELYSYVTGQEAWFVALNQTPLAANIVAMNGLVQGTAGANGEVASYTSDKFIQGVNTVNMIMVNMGTDPTKVLTGTEEYNGTYTVNGTTVMNMTSSKNTSDKPKNVAYDQYKAATGGQAPIFQSSAGGTAYTDGATGCYIAQGQMPPNGHSFYDGDYLTLFYSGIGIVLEYYH